jgi:hypothetical protein
MKTIIHICLADAIEPHEPSIPLPGGLCMQVFDVVEPVPGTGAVAASTAVTAPGVRFRRELPVPGITYEAHSQDEVVAILKRELESQWLIM